MGGLAIFEILPAEFRDWRRALREGDLDASLAASERVFAHLEIARERVAELDSTIQAYRVRWACENASLRPSTVLALTRFYRTTPCSPATQSKYEYCLTRSIAGLNAPGRRLPASAGLQELIVSRERNWGVSATTAPESEVAMVLPALRAMSLEAATHKQISSFNDSGFSQRFGAFKSYLGANLMDPRIAVAVVEANVAVANVLSYLLTSVRDHEGRKTQEIQRPNFKAPGEAGPRVEREDDSPYEDVDLAEREIVAGEATSDQDLPDGTLAHLASSPAQRPSASAYELRKNPRNAEVIDRYLKEPRSPEVWQLDLEAFLGSLTSDPSPALDTSADRRRALELILSADDIVCARAAASDGRGGDPKGTAKAIASSMTLLRTKLRKAADTVGRQDVGYGGALVYVSDHLLWERLRLDASAKGGTLRRLRSKSFSGPVVKPRRIVPPPTRPPRRSIWVIAAVVALLAIFGLAYLLR